MKIKNIVFCGLFLALSLVLPFLTGQIPQLGNAISPMHIPVLLCGFLLGWPYGLTVGFIAPLLRFALFGMPPIFPVGMAMAFELAVYGAVSGWLFSKLKHNLPMIYTTLITSMIAGRIVWGIVQFILTSLVGIEFSLSMFLSSAFIIALPGIVLQLVLIPPIILAANRYKSSPAK